MKTFSDRLRHCRQAHGLSQAELARKCGLSQSSIANYESGARASCRAIFDLAGVLGVDAGWLGAGHAHKDGQWPFQSIAPEEFWGMAPERRVLLERIARLLTCSPVDSSHDG